MNCSSGDNARKANVPSQETVSYETSFEVPSAAWIKKTNKIIDTFFQKTIYNAEFSGQFLVAKN